MSRETDCVQNAGFHQRSLFVAPAFASERPLTPTLSPEGEGAGSLSTRDACRGKQIVFKTQVFISAASLLRRHSLASAPSPQPSPRREREPEACRRATHVAGNRLCSKRRFSSAQPLCCAGIR